MTDAVERSLAGARLQAQLLTSFSSFAVVVASIGLYGLLAFTVASSRREWAVRLAIGASARDLQRMVLKQSMSYVLAGVVLGLALIAAVARPMSRLAYGVTLWNPVLIATCATLLTVLALIAAAVPASRAARISPAEALKDA